MEQTPNRMINIRILLLSIILSACGIHGLEKKGIYQELNPADYQIQMSNSAQIIDVRTLGEYEKSHIDGAINISYLSGDFKKMVDTLSFDKSTPVLIYCETQHRSLFAAKILAKRGYTHIIDLDKGMIHWRKSNMPYVESSSEIKQEE